jgi:hypothetical protein
MSGEWNDILPEGYEDVRAFNELRARKKQLDMVKTEGQQQHEDSQCYHVSATRAQEDIGRNQILTLVKQSCALPSDNTSSF